MAAKQPSINYWSNANVRGRKWHKIHVGKLRGSVCFIRRDLIGGHRGGFKSGGKRWLRISPLPMTGQWENGIKYTGRLR